MFLAGRELTHDSNEDIKLFAQYINNIANMTLDDNTSMFFARQLLQIEAKVYEQKYTKTQAVSLIPVDTSGGSGLEATGYKKLSSYGEAKWAGQEDTKSNQVESKMDEVIEVVRMAEVAYSFNFMDLRKAARLGLDLSMDGMNNAKRAINQFIDNKVWFGDSTVKIKGVFDSVYTSAYNTVSIPANGASSSTKITSKSYDNAIADMKAILSRTIVVSKGQWEPERCLMSIAIYEYLRGLEKANTDMTALQKLQGLYPNVEFVGVPKFDGAGPSSTDYILTYPNTPEVIVAKIPNPFEVLPTEKREKNYVTDCISEVSSVQVKYADAITYVAN